MDQLPANNRLAATRAGSLSLSCPASRQQDIGFSDVRARRTERQASVNPATSPLAEAIFDAVDQLLQKEQDNETQTHALQLAAIGLRMPYGDKQTAIHRLLQLAQPYNEKLGLFTALVTAGELIEATLVIDGVNALLEDAKAKPWLLQENQGTIDRWLSLLPFTDQPEATLEVLARLDPQTRLPWRLRPILSARLALRRSIRPNKSSWDLHSKMSGSSKNMIGLPRWRNAARCRRCKSCSIWFVRTLRRAGMAHRTYGRWGAGSPPAFSCTQIFVRTSTLSWCRASHRMQGRSWNMPRPRCPMN